MRMVFIILFVIPLFAFAELPTKETVLNTLQVEHPRLFLSNERLSKLQELSETDELLSRLVSSAMMEADKILNEAPADFIIIGPRLLGQSRLVLRRVLTLGLVYRWTKDEKYARRAKRELFAAAAFPHWNKSHFLDTAEMCNAFAIGYDWLYSQLTEYEKMVIRGALVEKGLMVGLQEIKNNAWWATVDHNWNQVCNGGLAVGALSLADEEPLSCAELLALTINNLPLAMKSYAPDGGWNEGPGYWGYATRYNVFAIAALQSALNTDFGLSHMPGFSTAGLFPIYAAGPTDLSFNFADASPHYSSQATLFWLGEKFNLPVCCNENIRLLEKNLKREQNSDVMNIVWYQPFSIKAPLLPKDDYYKGIQVVFMRSSWNNPDAFYIGFKGGDNQANHCHLDIGSFVLDALGVRWGVDLGSDDYNMPGYWGSSEGGTRWQYFRLNNFSHNTLTLNDDLQRVDAIAPMIKTDFTEKKSFAIADLSLAYQPHAKKVQRGIMLMENKAIVQDEIEWVGEDNKVSWRFMTGADIQLLKNEALLSQNDKKLHVEILAPDNVTFSMLSAKRDAPEKENKGYQILSINFEEKKQKTEIVVLFSESEQKVKIKPLEKW